MDRAEAIDILVGVIAYNNRACNLCSASEKENEALDLAIEALEREIEYGQMVVDLTKGEKVDDWVYDEDENATTADCDDCIWNTCNYNKIDWEVGEDCISRQQAIEEIALHDCTNGEVPYFTGKEVQEILKILPPVVSTFNKDCISRQDVLDLAKDGKIVSNTNYNKVVAHVKSLPPVTPTERTGEWEHHIDRNGIPWERCSECGDSTLSVDRENLNYCPNCGAKMLTKESPENLSLKADGEVVR